MKTVNVQVCVAVQVIEDVATEQIHLDIPLEAIKVCSALTTNQPIIAKVIGYTTEAVEEVEETQ